MVHFNNHLLVGFIYYYFFYYKDFVYGTQKTVQYSNDYIQIKSNEILLKKNITSHKFALHIFCNLHNIQLVCRNYPLCASMTKKSQILSTVAPFYCLAVVIVLLLLVTPVLFLLQQNICFVKIVLQPPRPFLLLFHIISQDGATVKLSWTRQLHL